jgi:hypothetical protein
LKVQGLEASLSAKALLLQQVFSALPKFLFKGCFVNGLDKTIPFQGFKGLKAKLSKLDPKALLSNQDQINANSNEPKLSKQNKVLIMFFPLFASDVKKSRTNNSFRTILFSSY